MPPEKGATRVPHKTRQRGALAPEKKKDASRFWQDASQLSQIRVKSAARAENRLYFLTIIFLTRGLPSTSSRKWYIPDATSSPVCEYLPSQYATYTPHVNSALSSGAFASPCMTGTATCCARRL